MSICTSTTSIIDASTQAMKDRRLIGTGTSTSR